MQSTKEPVTTKASTNNEDSYKRFWSKILLFTFFVIGLVISGYVLVWGTQEGLLMGLAETQFSAIIGVPVLVALSLFVVLVLRISTGPMKIEIGKLKFQGAAAPIIFWLLCFLAISTVFKMLWVA